MVEAATGVDPMVQARKEGKENARARAAERRQAQTEKTVKESAAVKPEPKKVKQESKAEQTNKNEKPRKKAAAKPKEMPKRISPKGKEEVPGQSTVQRKEPPAKESTPAPKRGVRQQRLEETLPAKPTQAKGEFVRRNPIEGARIMDATARL